MDSNTSPFECNLGAKRGDLFATTVLLVFSLLLAFVLHNPAAFLTLNAANFSTFGYNLFEENAGPLSSFYNDVAVTVK